MLQLVIPAYNEQDRLPRTLRELRRAVRRHRAVLGPVEVIVVDNASTDATAEVARAADSPALPVRVVACATRGKGAAVRAGVAATSAELVGFMDADGATHLDALLEATRHLALGAHVAIGSRAADGSDTACRTSRLRAGGARRYRRLARRIVPGVGDTQCGFKVFDGALAREVFAELRTAGFSFDVELLARCQARGARIAEFPVVWADVPGSTFVPLRHGAASFRDLAVIALRMRPVRAAQADRSRPAVLPAASALPLPVLTALPALPVLPALGALATAEA